MHLAVAVTYTLLVLLAGQLILPATAFRIGVTSAAAPAGSVTIAWQRNTAVTEADGQEPFAH